MVRRRTEDLELGRATAAVVALGALVASVAGCADTRGDNPFATGPASAGALDTDGPADGGGAPTGPGASGADAGDDDALDDSGGDSIKFDTPSPAGDGGLPTDGCTKVDFLFVIDNSLSMGDEQQNLAASFPQFIETIRTEVAEDWHVMVVDTDGEDKWDEDLAECHFDDCPGEPADEACGVISPQDDWTCGNLPSIDACDGTLGAGTDHDDSEARGTCGLVAGRRWFDDTQPNPDASFQCVAHLYDGNSPELTMGAMLSAIHPSMVDPGGCNEGFLRDDAVLVVTFISDEEDDGDSMGLPQSWRDDLIALKNGNETAVVVLGLLGDTGLPGAVCPPDSVAGSNGGEYSPRLIEFVETFGTRGLWGSVCAPDYGTFFDEAVSLIDTACDEYEPVG